MSFLLGSANSARGGYEISNSLRFGTNTDLKRLPSATGQSIKGTLSVWVKFATANTEMAIIGGFDNSGANDNDGYFVFKRTADGNLQFEGGDNVYLETTALYRDVSAWYHIVLAIDSGNSTANNKQRIYVNGVEVTAFDTRNNLTNLQDLPMNTTAGNDDALLIGCDEDTGGKGLFFDGYMSEFYWIDQNQYAASDFGETNDNGVWIPKEFEGSFGVNGVFLQFKQTGTSQNSSGIGADTGGNDNHFAVTNLAATDVTVDTPTNNFATLIPALNMALSEGNTKAVTTRTGNWDGVHSSIGVTSGKWYFEVKASRTEDNFRVIGGVAGNPENFTIFFNGQGGSGDPLSTYSDTFPFFGKGVWLDHWYDEDYNSQDGSASVQSNNDILQFALDMDNYKLWVGVNGQFKDNSNNNVSYSDVAAGNSATVTIASGAYTGKTFFPAVALRDDEGADDNIAQINFGNPSFSISSGNSDGLYGNFEYAVPSGYYALCTKRLATYG
jgi:hypothetical protein